MRLLLWWMWMFLDGFFVVFLVVFLFLLAEKFLRQRGKINERRKSNVTVVLKVECSSYVPRSLVAVVEAFGIKIRSRSREFPLSTPRDLTRSKEWLHQNLHQRTVKHPRKQKIREQKNSNNNEKNIVDIFCT